MTEVPSSRTKLHELQLAQRTLRTLDSKSKEHLLSALADLVAKERDLILAENQKDLADLPMSSTPAFRDRLFLDARRIDGMVQSLRAVAGLEDPVGEVVEERVLANQLRLKSVRAPLGLVLMIFESRPNVILEAFSLAFKSGNAIILRGGSESKQSARAIYEIMRRVFIDQGWSVPPFWGVENYDRGLVADLLAMREFIDVVVPRGGESLIQFVAENARMPIIKNDRGMCHTYVHADADLDMAVRIVVNAKTQRPGVCNAMETLLLDERVATNFLPKLWREMESHGVQWRVDEATRLLIEGSTALGSAGRAHLVRAREEDWDTEHLDLIMNVRLVSNESEAVEHIAKHGSKHSEVIVTRNEKVARQFQDQVDAAVVYWNASSRFTDGFEFGLGGELGVSTQKLHVRGPVGLRHLTCPRWVVDGSGQTRS